MKLKNLYTEKFAIPYKKCGTYNVGHPDIWETEILNYHKAVVNEDSFNSRR